MHGSRWLMGRRYKEELAGAPANSSDWDWDWDWDWEWEWEGRKKGMMMTLSEYKSIPGDGPREDTAPRVDQNGGLIAHEGKLGGLG